MMRVLHILPDLNPGGAQRMAVHLMRNLDRQRFEVEAVSLFRPIGTDLEDMVSQSGVPIRYLGKRRGPDPRMFAKIAQSLRSFRPHVIHTHRYILRYALPPMLRYRVPAMVHTVHNPAEKEVDWPGRWIQWMAFKSGVIPVAITQEVASSLSCSYRISGFPLIPNGIPIEAYRHPSVNRKVWRSQEGFASEDVLFVCVARLSPQKNPALLLESFAQGPASDPRAHLLFVGTGELRSRLEKRALALNLEEKIHFLGVRTDIPETLNATDIFVLSSDWEGHPLSVMEALAAGKPVIGTAVGGIPELVENNKSGLLVPKGDIDTLSGAMSYLVTSAESRRAMEEFSKKRGAEHFDVTVMTKAYEELYETAYAKN